MSEHTAFKASSFASGVDFVILERDSLGWKMDAYGKGDNSIKDGDTYQDSIDELMPFLKKFVDEKSTWVEYDTGKPVTFWQVLAHYFEELKDD